MFLTKLGKLKKSLLCTLFHLWLIATGFSQTITNVGTDFWVAFPRSGVSVPELSLFISSDFATSGTVSSAFPGVNQNFSVTPGIVTQITIPSGIQLLADIEDKGIHVVSNAPVSLYGLSKYLHTTDAYLALPVNALGLDYTVMSYKTTVSNHGSAFSVVATQNGTVLTIFNHQTSVTSNINLNQGQTYYVEAVWVSQDLTGSRIQSNLPVAVYGSVEDGMVTEACPAANIIVEQLFPIYSWGKNFVTVPLAGRDASGDIFRILTAQDGTDISINGTLVATKNTGEFYETNLT
jgi:hypothetical protein